MSARKQFFFRERVTEGELNAAFDDLENADHNLAADLGFTGVLANAVVSPHALVGDLTVDVSGPGILLDPQGARIFFSSLQNVSVAQDHNGVATAVSSAGHEKVVSVFVMFDRAVSDPRIDGNSVTVFFQQDEAFKFVVVQGAEAAAGSSVPPPLRADAILLADVTRRFGQGQIFAADISTARRQDALVVTGAPRSLRRGRTLEALSDLLSLYNAHVSGTVDRHPAAAIDYAGGGAWFDGVANPAATVEAQLDKIVTDLAAASGAAKLGAAATAGTPNALVAGSVKSQLDALLADINAHINNASGAHAASAIAYAGGGAWKDGTTNPAATVEAQVDKVVSDLTADAGAARVGTAARGNWLDGRANPAGVSVLAALTKIITDLSDQTAGADGAARIGAQASGSLASGSVRSQLDALGASAFRATVANVFTATQTFNGTADETAPALTTTPSVSNRRLLWDITGAPVTYHYRMYAGNQAFELTLNARWDGAQWIKDSTDFPSTKLVLTHAEFRLECDSARTSPFTDVWTSSLRIALSDGFFRSLDVNGNWTALGPTETYAGWEGRSPTGAQSFVGTAAAFRKVFPAVPSSITIVVLTSANIASGPTSFFPTVAGTGVSALPLSANTNTSFYARVIAQ